MAARNTAVRAPDVTGTARVRAVGDAAEADLPQVREEAAGAPDRPGLPPFRGEARVMGACAGQPWPAGAGIRSGSALVVVLACEASSRQLADRLRGRYRSRTDRAAYRAVAPRRTATPVPAAGRAGALDRPGPTERGGPRCLAPVPVKEELP
ncbi:hypothetical protein [Streptomyces sp. MUM 16J]|uniref:hypothetical protein n=1 Tax=Streptomyces sp. MUM 16J TaxID=2791988 RepID=UPI001F03B2F4|nr:hypothetical protein [Streptomyces sp. MUM 16J]MCH0557312.1 hypothetical protein [Streptomyces sp. MUM 16J]